MLSSIGLLCDVVLTRNIGRQIKTVKNYAMGKEGENNIKHLRESLCNIGLKKLFAPFQEKSYNATAAITISILVVSNKKIDKW